LISSVTDQNNPQTINPTGTRVARDVPVARSLTPGTNNTADL